MCFWKGFKCSFSNSILMLCDISILFKADFVEFKALLLTFDANFRGLSCSNHWFECFLISSYCFTRQCSMWVWYYSKLCIIQTVRCNLNVFLSEFQRFVHFCVIFRFLFKVSRARFSNLWFDFGVTTFLFSSLYFDAVRS